MNQRILHGDNLNLFGQLGDGSVRLIYMDPPFNTSRHYDHHHSRRAEDGSDGTAVAFDDRFRVDRGKSLGRLDPLLAAATASARAYLATMLPRLLEAARVLADDGALFVHCDSTANHWLRAALDLIFGPDRFQNEIVWRRTHAHGSARRLAPVHDTILFYAAGARHIWNDPTVPYSANYIEKYFRAEDERGRYQLITCTAPGDRTGTRAHYAWRGQWPPPGRHWAQTVDKMEALDDDGRLVHSSNGVPRQKRYVSDGRGVKLTDWWDDIARIDTHARERVGYETQKPVALLERIILACTRRGDLVMDPFAGSGTTAVAAQRHGRRWAIADENLAACSIALGRLRNECGDTSIPLDGFPDTPRAARDLRKRAPHVFGAWGCAMLGTLTDRARSSADLAVGERQRPPALSLVPLRPAITLPVPKTGSLPCSVLIDEAEELRSNEGPALRPVTLEQCTSVHARTAGLAG